MAESQVIPAAEVRPLETTTRRRWVTGFRGFLRRLLRTRLAPVALVILALVILAAICAPLVTPYAPAKADFRAATPGPSAAHWFGADNPGRDVYTRVVHGARVSLQVGIIGIPGYSRLTRGQVLSVARREYVEAARVVGVPDLRIIWRHILPNVLAPLIVQASLGTAFAILAEASLSVLGLAVQPPTPSWGAMLSFGKDWLDRAPRMAIAPGAAIFLTVLSFNFLGDGIRDALDPHLQHR